MSEAVGDTDSGSVSASELSEGSVDQFLKNKHLWEKYKSSWVAVLIKEFCPAVLTFPRRWAGHLITAHDTDGHRAAGGGSGELNLKNTGPGHFVSAAAAPRLCPGSINRIFHPICIYATCSPIYTPQYTQRAWFILSIFGNTVLTLTYDTMDYGSGYVLIENSFVVSN